MQELLTGHSLDNFRASLLMVFSMGLFAIEDALIKRATVYVSVGQILLMIGLCGFAVIAVFAKARGETVFSRGFFSGAVLVRNLAELIGTAGFVTALALTEITTASVILQAAPLAVTMGAALFLGEPVGWRRWVAIFVGLIGVVVILRPGFDEFQIEALWAVVGVLGLSARDVATRRVPKSVTTTQLSAWAFAAVAIAGLATLGLGRPPVMPDAQTAVELLCALAVGLTAYAVLTISVRTGELSVIAPLRYSRLVFALVVGYFVFGERPDWPMAVGAVLIVGSGLYSLMREARLRVTSH